jgi:hypothetical protein
MKLIVPSQYKDGFAALLTYSESLLAKLEKAIEDIGPLGSMRQLSRKVAERVDRDADEVADVLYAIGSLHSLRESAGITPLEMTRDLQKALSGDRDARLHSDGTGWKYVEAFLQTMVAPDSPLALTSKAAILRQEFDHSFCTAKIISDLRPVFRTDSERPLAAMVVHQLRLTYHETSVQTEDFFIALTKRDLLELRTLVERALRKDEQLRKLAEAADVRALDEEA